MCFTVLIPMIIGPLITLAIGINSFDSMDSATTKPPFEIFLAAAIIALLAFIPVFFVRKDADRLRTSLLAEKENENAADDALTENVSDTVAETADASETDKAE